MVFATMITILCKYLEFVFYLYENQWTTVESIAKPDCLIVVLLGIFLAKWSFAPPDFINSLCFIDIVARQYYIDVFYLA